MNTKDKTITKLDINNYDVNKFNFITPNKRNEFISKWLKENNIKIELYNFKTGKESFTYDLTKAFYIVFNDYSSKTNSKDNSLEIKELNLITYTSIIPLDFGDIILEKIKEYIKNNQ